MKLGTILGLLAVGCATVPADQPPQEVKVAYVPVQELPKALNDAEPETRRLERLARQDPHKWGAGDCLSLIEMGQTEDGGYAHLYVARVSDKTYVFFIEIGRGVWTGEYERAFEEIDTIPVEEDQCPEPIAKIP